MKTTATVRFLLLMMLSAVFLLASCNTDSPAGGQEDLIFSTTDITVGTVSGEGEDTIYISGYMKDDSLPLTDQRYTPGYLTREEGQTQLIRLTDYPSEAENVFTNMIEVHDGDIYVGGYWRKVVDGDTIKTLCYWKNGDYIELDSANYGDTTNSDSNSTYISGLQVDDTGVIYLAGTLGGEAKLFIDDPLEDGPVTIALTEGGNFDYTGNLVLDNGSVHVAGSVYAPRLQACYWTYDAAETVTQTLLGPAPETMYTNGSCIAVESEHIIVAGWIFNTKYVSYWEDGVQTLFDEETPLSVSRSVKDLVFDPEGNAFILSPSLDDENAMSSQLWKKTSGESSLITMTELEDIGGEYYPAGMAIGSDDTLHFAVNLFSTSSASPVYFTYTEEGGISSPVTLTF